MPVARTSIAYAPDGEALRYQVDGPGDLDGRPGGSADREPTGGAAGAARARPPVLTVHGLVSSVHHWTFFIPHFAAQRPVLSWHYRGHGGQPVPRDRQVSVAQFADDADAVASAAALGPAVVVGLSFGVQVALELYRRHPRAVRALVLICGTPGHPLDRVSAAPQLRGLASATMQRFGQHPRVARPLLRLLRSALGTRVARELAYLSGGAHRGSCPPEVLEGLFAHVAELDPELVGNVVAAYLEHSAEDMLPTISVPTLILAGDADQLTPVATAERMQRAIAGSELVVFPGHTHLVQVEAPDAVHAAIEAFLRKHQL